MAGEIQPDDEMQVCMGTLEEDQFLALFGRKGKLSGVVAFKRPRPLMALRRKLAEPDGISFADAVAEYSS